MHILDIPSIEKDMSERANVCWVEGAVKDSVTGNVASGLSG